MEKQITRLAPRPRLEKKKRVAAYARVSSGKDAMLHSLAEQVSYYSDLIRKEPGWIFAGVYADEAYTGTKEARPEFQRLLGDCRNGTVEISLPKWIQSHKSETALKPLEIRHFTAFAPSSAALGEGRFSVLCG